MVNIAVKDIVMLASAGVLSAGALVGYFVLAAKCKAAPDDKSFALGCKTPQMRNMTIPKKKSNTRAGGKTYNHRVAASLSAPKISAKEYAAAINAMPTTAAAASVRIRIVATRRANHGNRRYRNTSVDRNHAGPLAAK